MSKKSLADYYHFLLQSKKKKISTLDVFSNIENKIIFRDGSSLIYSEDESIKVQNINKEIELSYIKNNDLLYTCIKMDRTSETLSYDLTSRKLFLNFNEGVFFIKPYGEPSETLTKIEAVSIIDDIGLSFHDLNKSLNKEIKKNNEIKEIILKCLNRQDLDVPNNIFDIEKIRKSKNKP